MAIFNRGRNLFLQTSLQPEAATRYPAQRPAHRATDPRPERLRLHAHRTQYRRLEVPCHGVGAAGGKEDKYQQEYGLSLFHKLSISETESPVHLLMKSTAA